MPPARDPIGSRSARPRSGGSGSGPPRIHRHLVATRDRGPTLQRGRVALLLAIMILPFGLFMGRLVNLQAVAAERYDQLGEDQRTRTVTLSAERGSIFDRNGNDLAVSVPHETVWADPRRVGDPTEYAAALAPILGVDETDLALKLADQDKGFVYVARKVESELAERVRALKLPGIDFIPESLRMYPSDSLAGPVLGFVGLDNNGLAGIESQYESILVGTPGELVVESDPYGRELPSGRRSYEPSRRGSDVVLTIDQGLQYEVEEALIEEVSIADAKGGMAIVMDLLTGDILAMASVTGRSPTDVSRADVTEGPTDSPVTSTAEASVPKRATTARRATHKENNRPLTDAYEPGSTNKVITIARALEAGIVGPWTTFEVPNWIKVGDHVFLDHEQHPVEQLSTTDILRESSNVGTIQIAQLLGKQSIDKGLRDFGLGQETGTGFPGEASGLMLDVDDWYSTSIGAIPIGTGIAVTPMQMLNVYATIANEGQWRSPRLVSATIDAQGNRTEIAPSAQRQVVSPQTARQVSDMLVEVVTGGTGKNAAVVGYSVAGKTGTARKPLNGGYCDCYMASFAGFAPASDPRLAAIVVLDEPFPIYGGEVAAPAFSRIMQYALRLEKIAPTSAPAPVAPKPVERPISEGSEIQVQAMGPDSRSNAR